MSSTKSKVGISLPSISTWAISTKTTQDDVKFKRRSSIKKGRLKKRATPPSSGDHEDEAQLGPRDLLEIGATSSPYHQTTRSIDNRLPVDQSRLDGIPPLANDQPPIGTTSSTPLLDVGHHLTHHQVLLANSWLMILIVSPLTIALLVWLLVLLVRRQRRRRRRASQENSMSERLNTFNTGIATSKDSHLLVSELNMAKDAVTIKNKATNVNRETGKKCDNSATTSAVATASASSKQKSWLHADQSLLATSTSSSSSSSASRNKQELKERLKIESQPMVGQHEEEQRRNLNYLSALSREILLTRLKYFNSFNSLVDYTNNFLITLASQQILACSVIILIAILNIIRTRNLFCCNSIVFLFIVIKLAQLFSLTTFACVKLVKLINLPVSGNHYFQLARRDNCLRVDQGIEDSLRLNKEELKTASVVRASRSCKGDKMLIGQQIKALKLEIGCISEESSLEHNNGEVELEPFNSSARSKQQTSNDHKKVKKIETNCRVRLSKGRHIKKFDSKSHTTSSLEANQNLSEQQEPFEDQDELLLKRESARVCFSWLPTICLLVSCLLGVFCLYSRLTSNELGANLIGVGAHLDYTNSILMRHSVPSRLSAESNKTKKAGGADWTISIFNGPSLSSSSSTTEAGTRYDSMEQQEGDNEETNRTNTSDGSLEHFQAAGLSTAAHRFGQQSTFKLRQLMDQYELGAFAQLLFDTQLQTNRFSCSLASRNYAPIATQTLLLIYAILILTTFLLNFTIGRVGKRRLAQFSSCCLKNGRDLFGGHHKLQLVAEKRRQANGKLDKQRQLYLSMSTSSPSLCSSSAVSIFSSHGTKRGCRKRSALKRGPAALFNSKRHYNELLKQNLRHHQSAFELIRTNAGTNLTTESLACQSPSLLIRAGEKRPPLEPAATHDKLGVSSLLFNRRSREVPRRASSNYSCSSASASSKRKQQGGRKSALAAKSNYALYQQHRLAVSQPNNLHQVAQRALHLNAGQLAWLPHQNGVNVAASLSRMAPVLENQDKRRTKCFKCRRNSAQADKHTGDSLQIDCPDAVRIQVEQSGASDKQQERTNGDKCCLCRQAWPSGAASISPSSASSSTSSALSASSLSRAQPSSSPSSAASEQADELANIIKRQHQKSSSSKSQGQQQLNNSNSNSNRKSNNNNDYDHDDNNQELETRKRLQYDELKQDLRLTRLMIVFAQLLNHGPILVSRSCCV